MFDRNERLAALKELSLLDPRSEEQFSAILRIARQIFLTPIATISLIDDEREWVKAGQGIHYSEIPRSESLSAYAVQYNAPFVVLDASQDSRFNKLPCVADAPGIRFFAAFPLVTDGGEPIGTITVADTKPRPAADCTALRDLASWTERELERQRLSVEKMKEAFIPTVSHELRTPLTAIHGALKLLDSGLMGEIPAEAKELIQICSDSSARLVRLINGILNIAKAESAGVAYDARPHPIAAVIKSAADGNRVYAEQFRVKLTIDDRAPGIQITGDADRVMQIMTNLLANAIRYSPAGEAVKITILREGELVRIKVTNHGRPISKEFETRVFKKFSQDLPSDSKEMGGTGLGLSICKQLVDRMHGRIGYMNEPDGTTFYFDLPEAKVSAKEKP